MKKHKNKLYESEPLTQTIPTPVNDLYLPFMATSTQAKPSHTIAY